MSKVTIRPFVYQDLDAVIYLAKRAFADELLARGLEQDSFEQQIHMATRGRMLPFKLLAKFSGLKYGFFVAESKDGIVGFASFQGREQIEMANLMVAPEYRRQGIGQRLLQKRLEAVSTLDVSSVTTTILSSNIASLKNAEKQGFRIFDQYTIFARELSGVSNEHLNSSTARELIPQDNEVFSQWEAELVSSDLLRIQGSYQPDYFTMPNSFLSRLSGEQRWVRAFESQGKVVGFLAVFTSKHQSSGSVARPFVTDDNLPLLPGMLAQASEWLLSLEKEHIEIAVPHSRDQLALILQENGWQEKQTWVRLEKRL